MSKPLNILLFAEGHAGVGTLQQLRCAGHTITGCVTHLLGDRWAPSVLDECRLLEIPCATDPGSGEIPNNMSDRPDVVLSAGYRTKIHMPYLALGRLGAFNVAGSPLPQYRGAFPTRWALLNEEPVWGVSVHQLTPQFCDGALLHRRPVLVKPSDNAYDLHLRVASNAAIAAVEACAKLAAGDFHLSSTDSFRSKWISDAVPLGGRMDWNQPAQRLNAFVRAMDFGRVTLRGYDHLSTPAVANVNDRTIEIWRSKAGGTMSSYPAGTITRCDNQVWVQTGKGHLVIEKVCVDGRDHDAADYFQEKGISAGSRFDSSHQWDCGDPLASIERRLAHAA